MGTIDFAIRAKAKRIARAATVREKRLERQIESGEMTERPQRRWGLALDLGDAPENGRDVAILDDITVTLGNRTILDGLDLHIRDGERVVLTGQNGAGKSTLLRVIAGEIVPDGGTLRIGTGVVIGRFAQEQETVDPTRSVLDQVRAIGTFSETDARNFLHLFLFGGETVFKLAGDLSYGERARLALALLTLKGANFLLLDEPLNHLDLQARDQFEEALSHYSGTLLMVLHDRYATERLATRVLSVAGRSSAPSDLIDRRSRGRNHEAAQPRHDLRPGWRIQPRRRGWPRSHGGSTSPAPSRSGRTGPCRRDLRPNATPFGTTWRQFWRRRG